MNHIKCNTVTSTLNSEIDSIEVIIKQQTNLLNKINQDLDSICDMELSDTSTQKHKKDAIKNLKDYIENFDKLEEQLHKKNTIINNQTNTLYEHLENNNNPDIHKRCIDILESFNGELYKLNSYYMLIVDIIMNEDNKKNKNIYEHFLTIYDCLYKIFYNQNTKQDLHELTIELYKKRCEHLPIPYKTIIITSITSIALTLTTAWGVVKYKDKLNVNNKEIQTITNNNTNTIKPSNKNS